MNLFLAVTDNDWFRFLRSRAPIEEVSFWRPGGEAGLLALHPGEPLLFKLHAPENFVVGGGFFAHFSPEMAVSLAWGTLGEANGAASFGEMRRRIEKYRRIWYQNLTTSLSLRPGRASRRARSESGGSCCTR